MKLESMAFGQKNFVSFKIEIKLWEVIGHHAQYKPSVNNTAMRE